MKYFIGLLFVFWTGSVLSQSDTSAWIIGKKDPIAGGAYKDLFKYFTGGDTLIQGKAFQELWKYQYDDTFQSEYYIKPFYIIDTVFVGYLFRDSTKIQAIINEHANDLCPRLSDVCYDSLLTFYDLTLKVWNTLPPPCQSASSPDTIRTDSIMNVSMDNEGRIMFNILQNINGPGWYYFSHYNVVEDIGSSSGLFNRCIESSITDEPYYTLLLYCDSNGTNGTDCKIEGMAVGYKKVTSNNNLNIRVFPNPATSMLYIQLNQIEGTYSMQLLDIAGALKKRVTNMRQHKAHIRLSDLASGIYFLEIWQSDEIIIREKIIKQ